MNHKYVEQVAALFGELLTKEAATVEPESMPADATKARRITIPHPYYVVDGDKVLQGRFDGVERMAGYQSVVMEGETPVEILIAATAENSVKYAAAWPRRAAEALAQALRVAEENQIFDTEFSVVTVPEVAFNAVWFRDRHALIPLRMGSQKSALDWSRVYSEAEVIAALQAPLRARFAIVGSGVDDDNVPRPPRA